MRKKLKFFYLLVISFLLFFSFITLHSKTFADSAECGNLSADGGFQFYFKCTYQNTSESARPALVKSFEVEACTDGSTSIPSEDKEAACNYIRLGLYELDSSSAFIQGNPIDILRLAISLFIGGAMLFVTFKIILLGYEIASLGGESDKLKEKLTKLAYYILGLVLALTAGGIVLLLPNLLGGGSKVTNILQACDDMEAKGYSASIVARCRQVQESTNTQ